MRKTGFDILTGLTGSVVIGLGLELFLRFSSSSSIKLLALLIASSGVILIGFAPSSSVLIRRWICSSAVLLPLFLWANHRFYGISKVQGQEGDSALWGLGVRWFLLFSGLAISVFGLRWMLEKAFAK